MANKDGPNYIMNNLNTNPTIKFLKKSKFTNITYFHEIKDMEEEEANKKGERDLVKGFTYERGLLAYVIGLLQWDK